MTRDPFPSRRSVLALLAATPALAAVRPALAEPLPKLVVTRDPNCGCCGGWIEHMRRAGFPVEVVESAEVNRLKARLGVPQALAACHTAEIDRYVIEGHVPADAVARLLKDRPEARGLAVPGMPVGSPGMEGGEPETYEVVLFGPSGRSRFGLYRGDRPA